ncbi:hypothetical protein I4F81_009704 [Pyropia yezoensis]|uniref:Uncharacterized protein n=1 Tax=Pyropia yezoensis TaxID=2788 RepID=A0ACC3CAI4_PYRYE|nr:hypothetical protein I4F81_009704 [Neopyropia yezoensis]
MSALDSSLADAKHAPNGLAALSALADGSGDTVVAAISAVARPLGSGGFQSATGEDLYIAEPARVTFGARTSDLGVSVSRTALMGALSTAAGVGAPGGVEVVWQSAVRHFEVVQGEEGVLKVDVQLETAGVTQMVRGVDVLVGADGLWSGVRSAVDEVTGRVPTPRTYGGLMWWRGSVSYSAVEARCADIGRLSWAQAWLPRGASLGYIRLGGDDLAWFASAPRPADAPVEGGSPLAEFLAEFGPDRGTTPPVYAAVVAELASRGEAADCIYRGPIYSRGVPSGPGWGVGPVTLVGDAAHAIFPSMGQGACVGIEDAVELAACLAAAWRSQPLVGAAAAASRGTVPAALRAFEAARAPRVTRMGVESARVYHLSALTAAPGIWLRDTAYSMLPQWVVDRQFSWLFSYKATVVA